jgi:hypothetical protein
MPNLFEISTEAVTVYILEAKYEHLIFYQGTPHSFLCLYYKLQIATNKVA